MPPAGVASTLTAAAVGLDRTLGSPLKKACGGLPSSTASPVPNAAFDPQDANRPITGSDLKFYMDQIKGNQQSMLESLFGRFREKELEQEANFAALEGTARATLASVDRLLTKTTNLEEKSTLLETRIAALEGRPIGSSEIHAERFDALESRVADLLKQVADLTAALKSSHLAAAPAAGAWMGQGGPPAQSPRGSHTLRLNSLIPAQVVQQPFAPSAAFLRGWSDFESRSTSMLPSETVVKMMQEILRRLPDSVGTCIQECSAPFFRNWQGTFRIKKNSSPDELYAFAKECNSMLKEQHIVLNGKPLYVAVEKPAWKREQNGLLAKADRVARNLVDPAVGAKFTLDWQSGQLWLTHPVEALLGGPRKSPWGASTFKWCEPALQNLHIVPDKAQEMMDSDF